MFDSSHVRFAAEIEWGNSYHYTDTYLLDGLADFQRCFEHNL